MSKLNIWRTFPLLRWGLAVIFGLIFLIGLLVTMNAIRPPDVAHAQVSTTNETLFNVVQVRPQASAMSIYAETSVVRVPLAQVPLTTTVPIPKDGAYIGAYIGDLPASYPASLAMVQVFECMTGRRLAIINRFWVMTINDGQYADFKWLNLAEYFVDGIVLMISWNPLDSTTTKPITYQGIIDGQYDYVIRPAAQDAAEFGQPMFIRWSWEMDGDWYSHSGPNAFGPDGTQPWDTDGLDLLGHFGDPDKADGPERFVAAWRHIRTIFAEEGADNVIWVWSPNWLSFPNVSTAPWNTLSAYYPGDDQVDWLGTSIYFRGDDGNQWLSFPEMFNHQTFSGLSMAEFHALHPEKPVMVAEMGAAEKSEDDQAKAEWITHTYGTAVKEYPYIKALLWFSVLKEDEEIDWRVNSSEVSLDAFRIAISDTYYLDQVFIAGNNSKPCKIFLPRINKS